MNDATDTTETHSVDCRLAALRRDLDSISSRVDRLEGRVYDIEAEQKLHRTTMATLSNEVAKLAAVNEVLVPRLEAGIADLHRCADELTQRQTVIDTRDEERGKRGATLPPAMRLVDRAITSGSWRPLIVGALLGFLAAGYSAWKLVPVLPAQRPSSSEQAE